MSAPQRPPSTTHPPVLLAIVGLCAGLESALTLMGMPPFGLDSLRRNAILYGAFWPGLLHDLMPVFTGQRVTMFFTYSLLHGGFLHMLFNMLILLHLGREAVQRLGQAGFALVYMLCAAGGGLVYALLSSSDVPMLGASGAVFGLFGTSMFWEFQRRRAAGATLEPVWRLLTGLVVMNVVLFFLVGGMLAWQAHLGGFLTGLLLAWIVTPTLRHRWRPR